MEVNMEYIVPFKSDGILKLISSSRIVLVFKYIYVFFKYLKINKL